MRSASSSHRLSVGLAEGPHPAAGGQEEQPGPISFWTHGGGTGWSVSNSDIRGRQPGPDPDLLRECGGSVLP